MKFLFTQFGFGAIAYLAMGIQSAVAPQIEIEVAGQINLLAILLAFAVQNFGEKTSAFWTMILSLVFGLQYEISPGISLITAGLIYAIWHFGLQPGIGKSPLSLILFAGIATGSMSFAVVISGAAIDVSLWPIVWQPAFATMLMTTAMLVLIHGSLHIVMPTRLTREKRAAMS